MFRIVQARFCMSQSRFDFDRRPAVPWRYKLTVIAPDMTMKRLLLLLLLASPIFAQNNFGELRLKITDPAGAGVKLSAQIVCEANEYQETLWSDESGILAAKGLPFGVYRIQIRYPGFAPYSTFFEVRSAIPVEHAIHLTLAALNSAVEVTDSATLVDPYRIGTVNHLGSNNLEYRLGSLPGRALQDMVNSQPGWIFEGNAVLHPRGSEYQTQFVVDGIPLTDNRSPGIGAEISSDTVQSMSVYTADFPAEYGRKMGGVVEVSTVPDAKDGLHGEAILSGGSFNTAGAFARVEYHRGNNTFGASASGDFTDRYLNPPVLQNFTNTATTGDYSVNYERDFSGNDHIRLSVEHSFSRFLIPNEMVQQAALQRQDGDHLETMGVFSYQHVFTPSLMGEIHAMVRDNSSGLSSNPDSTPIIAFQQNRFREGYFKAAISGHHSRHEWKAGVESDSTFLHEHFSDLITESSQFDPGTPPSFTFSGARPDLEQAAFVQDFIRLGKWTVSAGLRWDHYQLIENQNALSPRLGIARYFPAAGLVVHFAYDRVFQTPDFRNILLSSSPAVESLNPSVLRLPVSPSHGNYFESGFTKGFWGDFRLDANYFLRRMDHFADDDLLLNTSVAFPISFDRASIYGAEAKLELPHWRGLSGFVNYSYIVGSVYFPVTGGLFLGDDATNAQTRTSGRFWDSQDQRNTVRTRFRYQLTSRTWVAAGADYGSGLPVDFAGTQQQAIAQYGRQIVDRVNFARGRVRPSLSLNFSAGANLCSTTVFYCACRATSRT